MNNLYYVSGIHSSGKTTLVNRLVSDGVFELLERVNIDIKSDEPFIRAFLRLLKYYAEYLNHLQIQEQKTQQKSIGDRCVYDTLAYVNGYLNLGWINIEQHDKIFAAYKRLWTTNNPHKIIYLDPPFEWVIECMKGRWLKSPKRWQEDNLDYLKAVMNSYKHIFYDDIYNLGLSPLIIKETSLEGRVKIVKEWITKIYEKGVRHYK